MRTHLLKFQAGSWKFNKAFTLIEALVAIGLFAVLATFTTVNLLKPQSQASIQTAIQTLIADIRQQQLETMEGEVAGSGGFPGSNPQGIYFESNRYTLFPGPNYILSDPGNFAVDLASNLSIVQNLPSNQIIFSRRSGEFSNFIAGPYTISIQNTATGEQKTITINKYGVVESIN